MILFGQNAELTELARLIMSEDIEALEKYLSGKNDINKKFKFSQEVEETPLTLALCENKTKVIEWLITKNVELNDKEYPSITIASSNGNAKIMKLLVDNGADVNLCNHHKKSAMKCALYSNNYEAVSFLLDNGYDMKNDGSSLRQAVSNRQRPAIRAFLAHKIDVNFCTPDMVYPYNSTPVHIAAQNNDLRTVKLLVEHGADVTIKDKYGQRPYNCAVDNKNDEMIQYIKSLEPERWHNEQQRLVDLKSYKLPPQLIAVLCSENRTIELPDNDNVKCITFSSLLDVKEVNWQKHKFLDLLSNVDNYGNEGFLVWYPKKKCIAFADYEHGEFHELCSIKEFLQNPSVQIDKIFN